jgi:hypothetical protein
MEDTLGETGGMDLRRRGFVRRFVSSCGSVVLLLGLLASTALAEEGRVIPLWPEGVPDARPNGGVERMEDGRVYNVQIPTLTVFPAPAETAVGTAVIICPGGSYGRLAVSREGSELVKRLNALGVSAFVLKSRLVEYGHPAPLRDELLSVHDLRLSHGEMAIGRTGGRAGCAGHRADRARHRAGYAEHRADCAALAADVAATWVPAFAGTTA